MIPISTFTGNTFGEVIFIKQAEKSINMAISSNYIIKHMIGKMMHTISQLSKLSDDDLTEIRALISVKHLNTGDFWFFAGEQTEKVAYISKEYLRKYFIV